MLRTQSSLSDRATSREWPFRRACAHPCGVAKTSRVSWQGREAAFRARSGRGKVAHHQIALPVRQRKRGGRAECVRPAPWRFRVPFRRRSRPLLVRRHIYAILQRSWQHRRRAWSRGVAPSQRACFRGAAQKLASGSLLSKCVANIFAYMHVLSPPRGAVLTGVSRNSPEIRARRFCRSGRWRRI